MASTYYEVLGVDRRATPAQIRAAYVALARTYHPDFHNTATAAVRAANEKAMQAVNEAWNVLSDPAARQRYESRLADDRAEHRTAGANRGESWRQRAEATARERAAWRPFDFDPLAPDDLGDGEFTDPRLLDDEPSSVTVSVRKQVVTVLPALLFLAGLILVGLGLVINLLPLAALGLVGVIASALAFFVLPLFALSASARNDRR